MSTPAYEFEMEALPEYEYEYEGESEFESEGEYEAEEFFGRLAGLARRAVQSPALRRIGLRAARSALRGLGGVGGALGGAIGGARGASLGRALGSTVGQHASGWLPQREYEGEYEMEGEFELEGEYEYEGESEFEGEFELEGEYEVNPQRRIYNEAMMEHLGHAAAEAETEEEAEAFIGALASLASGAARLGSAAGRVGSVGGRLARGGPLARVVPQLSRGATNIVRTLRRNPTTRPLVRTLPNIMQRTARSLAQQARRGQPVTPQIASRTLAQQTARVIGSPQSAVQAYRRSRALDRRFHPRIPGAAGGHGVAGGRRGPLPGRA
jgi:hypothetical protein